MRSGATLALLLILAPAQAAEGRRDLHGIALGMTGPALIAAAGMPCSTDAVGDITCHAPDGTTYKAVMSGGTPPIALTVTHSLCTTRPEAAVLADALRSLGVPSGAARTDPTGYYFDISGNGEAVLDGAVGTCPGGKRYDLSIRGDSLIKGSLKQARTRRRNVQRGATPPQ